MAPEVLKGPVPVHVLLHTDTFSLGLPYWVIFLGGGSPEDCIGNRQSSRNSYFEEIKAEGTLLKIPLDTKEWLESFAHAKYDQSFERTLDGFIANHKNMPAYSKLDGEQMQSNRSLLLAKMFDQMLLSLTKSSFLIHLLKVFRSSLRLEPQERNLETVVIELKAGLPSFER